MVKLAQIYRASVRYVLTALDPVPLLAVFDAGLAPVLVTQLLATLASLRGGCSPSRVTGRNAPWPIAG